MGSCVLLSVSCSIVCESSRGVCLVECHVTSFHRWSCLSFINNCCLCHSMFILLNNNVWSIFVGPTTGSVQSMECIVSYRSVHSQWKQHPYLSEVARMDEQYGSYHFKRMQRTVSSLWSKACHHQLCWWVRQTFDVHVMEVYIVPPNCLRIQRLINPTMQQHSEIKILVMQRSSAWRPLVGLDATYESCLPWQSATSTTAAATRRKDMNHGESVAFQASNLASPFMMLAIQPYVIPN